MANTMSETMPRVGTGAEVQTAAHHQAYVLLHVAYVLVPIIAGIDKFFHLAGGHLLGEWHRYLAPEIAALFPGDPHVLMYIVGGVEIVAGLLVAFAPVIGGYVVAGWLAAIIVNLVLLGGYFDIALRDFGLMLGALALARLALSYHRPRHARTV